MTPEARLLFALHHVEALVGEDVEVSCALRSAARRCDVDGITLTLLYEQKLRARDAARAALANEEA